MTVRRFTFVLVILTFGGYPQAGEPPADRLNSPKGRVEMVLDSDM